MFFLSSYFGNIYYFPANNYTPHSKSACRVQLCDSLFYVVVVVDVLFFFVLSVERFYVSFICSPPSRLSYTDYNFMLKIHCVD